MPLGKLWPNGRGVTSETGPGCVKTCASRECAELFSVLSPFYCDWQQCSFPIERNRDNISTCKFDVGVFTQPESTADIAGLAAGSTRSRLTLTGYLTKNARLPREEVQRPSALARLSRFCGLIRIKPCLGASISAIRSKAIEMTKGSTVASFLTPFRDR